MLSKIYGERLIKVDLLNEGLQVIEVGLKREIVLLTSKKRLKDLYHMSDVFLIRIHYLEGLPKRVCQLDACERLDNALLDG